jgi:manganese/zinc/iron transport system permease protein
MIDLWGYFTDPVLRAPMLGCLTMAVTAALIGTTIVFRRQSLIGEVLSHAAFPGVILGVLLAAPFFSEGSEAFSVILMSSAFVFSLLGIAIIQKLEKLCKLPKDAILCFILAIFFGLGVLIASRIQVLHTAWYKQALVFLFGQAATMTDHYLPIYGVLALTTIAAIVLMYPRIQAILFDAAFSKSIGIAVERMGMVLTVLVALAVVIGMRSMGAVLMAGMLIAPAIAARPWCSKLSSCFFLSCVFAILAAFLGNVISVEGTKYLAAQFPNWRFSLPTGPLILIIAAFFCFLSLFFAPQGGVISRLFRKIAFKQKILSENLLKVLWKKGRGATLNKKELLLLFPQSRWVIFLARSRGWIELSKGRGFSLSAEGWARACHIVRLHRLWEVYLVEYVNQGIDRVHQSAEDFEHIMDEALEKQLEDLLGNLKADPHLQPIPSREEGQWQ